MDVADAAFFARHFVIAALPGPKLDAASVALLADGCAKIGRAHV